MIILKATTESLQLVTSSAAALDYSISFVDITTTTFSPSSAEGKITSATTTSAVAAPAASTQRQVKLITVSNRDAVLTDAVYLQKLISATSYVVTPTTTLLPGETLQYMDGMGWVYYSSTGSVKAQQTAAGTTNQVQYNSAGTLAGSAGLTYDPASSTLVVGTSNASIDLASSNDTVIPAPGSGMISIFSRTVANRSMITQIGASGLDVMMQPLLARNKIGYWCPPGNSTTVPGVFGITALTANGTATARNVATTSLATRMRRIGYVSTTTAGTFAGARLPVAQFSAGSGTNDGSGFMLIERWVESDAATVSGRRAFHGMTSSTSAFTNTEVDTRTNLVGIGQLSSDATQWYWIASGSTAQTATAVGASVGAPGGISTTAWELAIFAPNGVANTYYIQLTNLTTGVSASRTASGAAAVVPQSSTLLAWNAWATNNAATVVAGIDLCSLYIETDN